MEALHRAAGEDAETDRGRPGGDGGRPERGRHRLLERGRERCPMAPELDVAGEQDDAVVDAGADDDRAQEGGLGVDVADPEIGKGEGDGHADQQRGGEQHQLAHAAEEQAHHASHQHHHQKRGAHDVASNRLQLHHCLGNRPGETLEAHPGRPGGFDDVADAIEQPRGAGDVERAGRGADEDHRQVAAFGHEEPGLGVGDVIGAERLARRAHIGDQPFGFGVRLALELDESRVGSRLLLGHHARQPRLPALELVDGKVVGGKAPEIIVHLFALVFDREQGAAQSLLERGDQLRNVAAQRRRLAGERDGDVAGSAYSLGERLELDHAGRIGGKQLRQVGLQLEPRAEVAHSSPATASTAREWAQSHAESQLATRAGRS